MMHAVNALGPNGHIKTAEQRAIIQQYADWYTTLAVDGWGGLLHLAQRGGAWVGCGPVQSPPRCTQCNKGKGKGKCIYIARFL